MIGYFMHQPVLLQEVIQYLNPRPNKNFIDCTIGGGGHALKILEEIFPNGKLLGIDLFTEAIDKLNFKCQTSNLKNRIILINDNFINLNQIIKNNNFHPIHGILLDLGLSSDLLEKSERGFSFKKDEILDMRFNPAKQFLTATDILNEYPENKLIDIFKKFGEEKFSKLIARQIILTRRKKKVETTTQLVNLIKVALRGRFHKKSLTRIFQALRITVNNELENLEKTLPQALEVLAPNGRLVIISYHSLEDRIVKNFFKNNRSLRVLTKKPIRPSSEEIKRNPRSRSAKLRAAEKIINQ